MIKPSQSKKPGLVVDGIYENGLIRPDRPLPFNEAERIRITVETRKAWAERTAGIVPWSGAAEDLERIAMDPEFDAVETE